MQILKVEESGTLKNIFKNLGIPNNKWEELAIVNGQMLEDKVTKGTLLKVVKR